MVVRVSKRRWLRGGDKTGLLVGTKMCCLGFAARQLGQSPADIRGCDMPGSLPDENMTDAMMASPFVATHSTGGGWDGMGVNHSDSRLSLDAASINDDERLTDGQRMKALRALFAKNGHRIVFVP